MAEKLIAVSEPNLIQSGIVKSLHPLQVPLWIAGQNVVFEDGSVRKSPGYVKAFESPIIDASVMGLQDVLVGITPNLIFGDADNLYRFNGTSVTIDGTGYAGSVDRGAFQDNAFQDSAFVLQSVPRASLWSMENWGSWGVASNGVDPIQLNKMTGLGFSDLTGTPPLRAEVIVKFKIYLLAFNTDLGGAYIEWCDDDNIEDWVNGSAGFIYVRDLDSDIVCACKMGDLVAFYSANSMGIVQYIGPDFYFGAKVVLTGIGAVGKFSVVEHDSRNYGISYQGIWVTDGAGYEYISPPLLREWLQKNVNWGSASKIAGGVNEDRSLIEWGLPMLGESENTVTIGYNTKTQAWTFRDYGITCYLKKNNFRYPIFGTSVGGIYFGEYSFDKDGQPMDSWVQTRPMPGEDAMFWKDIEYLIAHLHDLAGSGLEILIGTQESLEDTISWSSPIFPGASSTPLFGSGFGLGAGKWISLKIRSQTLGANWRFSGFELYGVNTGKDV